MVQQKAKYIVIIKIFESLGFEQKREIKYEGEPERLGNNLDERYIARIFRDDNKKI